MIVLVPAYEPDARLVALVEALRSAALQAVLPDDVRAQSGRSAAEEQAGELPIALIERIRDRVRAL